MKVKITRLIAIALTCLIVQPPFTAISASSNDRNDRYNRNDRRDRRDLKIKHLVVIFGENISFDHYFGTYPQAANPAGDPVFTAAPDTPGVNGLSGALLTSNPNALNPANGTGAINPFRLARTQAWTADQGHNYNPEQLAYDKGLMDLFPLRVGTADNAAMNPTSIPVLATKGLNMGYYDGNTVTALWNYAQHFAMSDNSYSTVFGPSTPGALNLVSGQTNGVETATILNGTGSETDGGSGSLSVVGDPDPLHDICSGPSTNQIEMKGKNVGDLLNAAGVTWGWFQGGFDLSRHNPNGSTGCTRSTVSPIIAAVSANPSTNTIVDYSPHHEPFQYYASTRNPMHLRPASVHTIGQQDAANHQYDIEDFYAAVNAGNFPEVNFLKASRYQDAHPANSDPLDEQAFIVKVVNFLQQRADWCETAVVIAYDDSDGWYDHQMSPIINQSTSPADGLTAAGACGNGAFALAGPIGVAHAQGRCGYGPRQPLLLVSAWAKQNFVDHTVTDQSSILRFIEDNWLDGERIGDGSFDAVANSLENMFEFHGEGGEFRKCHCDEDDVLFLNEQTGLREHRRRGW